MTWKDDHRSHKEKTDLSWQEYHDEYFVHTDDLGTLKESIDTLNTHVQAVKNTYRDMQEEVSNMRILFNRD